MLKEYDILCTSDVSYNAIVFKCLADYFLFVQDFAKDRYGVPQMVQSQQKLGQYSQQHPPLLCS